MTRTSTTAYVRAFGSEQYARRVAGLSTEERIAVRAGETVFFDCGRPAGGNHGTTLRRVVEIGGRFYSRVPTEG